MRVIKKLYNRDGKTLLASRSFDSVIKSIDAPMNFDTLEFSFGYGFTFVNDGIASVGIDMDDPFLDEDERIIKTLVRVELHRALRRKNEAEVPRIIEDVLICRHLVDRGYAEDLVYLFYNFLLRHRIGDGKDFLRFNIPWIIFSGRDAYYSELFLNMAKSVVRKRYESETSKLTKALAADLSDGKNLERAVRLYGEYHACP